MKKICKNIFICILSATLFICSVTNTYITVYATEEDTEHGGGGSGHEPVEPVLKTWEEKFYYFGKNFDNFCAGLLCQIGAIKSGDLEQYFENRDLLESIGFNEDGTINTDNVTYDETTDSITMNISSLLNTFAGQIGMTIYPARFNPSNSDFDSAVSAVYGNDSDYLCYMRPNSSNTLTGNPDSLVYVFKVDLSSCYLSKYNGGDICLYDHNDLSLKQENLVIYAYYDGFEYSSGKFVLTELSNTIPLNTTYYKFDNLRKYMLNNISFAVWNSKTDIMNFLAGNFYLGSSFGQNGTITIPVSDLDKDWETAYNKIVTDLDAIKEATGERPTQEQIDDAIKGVLGKLEVSAVISATLAVTWKRLRRHWMTSTRF